MKKSELKKLHKLKNKSFKEMCKKLPVLPDILPAVRRIIVIGDLHGDWEKTLESLRIGKVINKDNKWIGEDTVVVQLGDQIDRCRFNGIPCERPEATKPDEASDITILKFFTDLHNQAQKKGGAVYSILGNHELMNVDGDMRYVSYMNNRDFDKYKKPNGKKFNSGEEARVWAFKPGNPLANFLGCTRLMALIIGKHLFVHAGIIPEIANKYSVKDLNTILSLYLMNKITNPQDYTEVLHSGHESPLWNRIFGNININQKDCNKLMKPLEKIYKVGKIYVGHTPQLNQGINSSCNGRVILADYGVSKAFDDYDIKYQETGQRADIREVQVLEILNDGNPTILK